MLGNTNANLNKDQNLDNLEKKVPFLGIIAVLSVVVIVVLSVYVYIQRGIVSSDLDVLKTDIVSLNNDITVLNGQKLASTDVAQKYLKAIENNEVLWSQAFYHINSLIPFDASAQKPLFNISSYSGSDNGKITLNVRTNPTLNSAYEDAAKLIDIFKNSSYFSGVYAPSVTRGDVENGGSFTSFVLNFSINKGDDGSLAPSVDEVANPKVARPVSH